MIVKQNIYSYKRYNRIGIEYDDRDMSIISIDNNDSLQNHPYFVVDDPQMDIFKHNEVLWISDDFKVIPISDALELFNTASDMINVLRQKKTSSKIIDYINYLKL